MIKVNCWLSNNLQIVNQIEPFKCNHVLLQNRLIILQSNSNNYNKNKLTAKVTKYQTLEVSNESKIFLKKIFRTNCTVKAIATANETL